MEIQLFLHKAKHDFLAKIKNSDLKAYEEAKIHFGHQDVEYYASRSSNRVFFSDLTREPLQYLIRSHFTFHM